jgi:hypothetical protein
MLLLRCRPDLKAQQASAAKHIEMGAGGGGGQQGNKMTFFRAARCTCYGDYSITAAKLLL